MAEDKSYKYLDDMSNGNAQEDVKLLVIELDNIDSVPRVLYKGEEITNKVHVGFDWRTQNNVITFGSPHIDIEYLIANPKGKTFSKQINYNGYFQDGEQR